MAMTSNSLLNQKQFLFWGYSGFLSFLFFLEKHLFFFLVLDGGGGGSLLISLSIRQLLLRQIYLNAWCLVVFLFC